jgi:hypothetical protein
LRTRSLQFVANLFEDLPARHASLNGIQKRFKIEASKGILVFLFNAISYNSVRGVGRMKQLHTGVTLPQCIAGAGSWRKQMKDVRMMKTVQMLFSVIRDFIVIAV